MMPKRRTILKVSVFLLLGAAANVAVAWGLALLVPIRHVDYACPQQRGDAARECVVSESFGTENLFSGPSGKNQIFGLPTRDISPEIPSRLNDMTAHEWGGVESRGWPCLSMRWWFISSASGNRISNGLELSSPMSRLVLQTPAGGTLTFRYGISSRVLPMQPRLLGFAINTVFYAAILWGGWLLAAAPFALRRRRRAKRGLCPACAYPVGTSEVCTECGKPIQSRPTPRIAMECSHK